MKEHSYCRLAARPSLVPHTMPVVIVAMFIALLVGSRASAQAYPGGVYAYGTVTQTTTFSDGNMFMFVVKGTTDAGTSGSTTFFIDLTTADASFRVSNVLAAAAAGVPLSIWNYGQTVSYGGQTGYASALESVSW